MMIDYYFDLEFKQLLIAHEVILGNAYELLFQDKYDRAYFKI